MKTCKSERDSTTINFHVKSEPRKEEIEIFAVLSAIDTASREGQASEHDTFLSPANFVLLPLHTHIAKYIREHISNKHQKLRCSFAERTSFAMVDASGRDIFQTSNVILNFALPTPFSPIKRPRYV